MDQFNQESTSPFASAGRKILPLPKRSRHSGERNLPPSISPSEASQDPNESSTGPVTPQAFKVRSESGTPTEISMPSLSSRILQSNAPQANLTPLTLGGLLNASPQPQTTAAKGDQASELHQTMGNLTLGQLDNTASIGTAAVTFSEPYDINNEPAPKETFYSPDFQTALKDGVKVACDAAAGLTQLRANIDNEALKKLRENARMLRNYRSLGRRTIAVLGDSGQGKSSLINSILHYPEIAQTGDGGAACTSVVTEYMQKTVQHTAPITVEVERLSQSGIEELIKELVWNYRQMLLPDVESNDIPPDEYQRLQRESDLAWSTLKAAFNHRHEFRPELLNDRSTDAGDRIIDQLIQWTHDLEWPRGDLDSSDNCVWKSTAQTAEECCEKTSRFMEDRLWPFTKSFGLQDTNLARVRATQDYLLTCDHIFVVANISRAITDQSLKSSLYHALTKHVPHEWETSAGQYLNVAVVCTKIDDINEEASRKRFCGPGNRIEPSVMEAIDQQIEAAKRSNDRKLKKKLGRRRQFLLVQARNDQVTEGLRSAYAAKVPGGSLAVFCVSNKLYKKFSEKKGDPQMVQEMIQASGIPPLRSFCHSITAQSQLLEAKHFLASQLGSLLNSLRIRVNSCLQDIRGKGRPVQLRGNVEDYLDVVESETLSNFQDASKDLGMVFQEQLLEFTHKRNGAWETAAGRKGLEWHDWHYTQYNAWCLKNGHHFTIKRGDVNWNQDLIWKMKSELEFQWELVEEEVVRVINELLGSLIVAMKSLQASIAGLGPSSDELKKGIDLYIGSLQFNFNSTRDKFTRELRTIRRKTSEGNQVSYVVHEMVPAYRSAALESGRGMSGRQKQKVQDRITNGTLFPNISFILRKNLDDLSDRILIDTKSHFASILDPIRSDLGMILNMYSVPVETGDEAALEKFDGLLKRLEEKHDGVLSRVQALT